MPTYKHNDYYRYIKYIQQKGISDPQWFWSDSEDASQARQWLYNNGASAIVNDIYKNTPEEIQKTIPSNYLSQNLQNTRYINDVRKRNENAGKVVTEVAAGVAGAPALITGVTVAPIATGLGLLGGTAGSIGGSKIGSRVGNAVYSRETENDGVGSLVSTNRETGATVGGLVGGTIGGIAGASIVKPIANSQVYKGLQLARALNKGVKNAEIVDSPVTQNILAGKLGWAPRQNKVIWHNSETPISKLESTFPAWDIVKRDAPLGHVWGTGTETTQGFIGARPFHLRSTNSVEMNKPMVQLNEAIGNGNNAVRNEILKFADRSGADAVNFSNIKDNTLPNQDVYAVFKDIEVKPKLSEAERLGIPKSLRSDPRTLEDPYYWGYEQWNQRYDEAVKAGNMKEAQRLRDLHFKIKTSLEPKHYYHGTNTRFTQFDENYIGTLDPGWYGRGFYFAPDKGIAEGYASAQTGPNVIYDSFLNVKNPIYRDAGIWDDTIVGTKIPETNDGVFVRLGELDKSLQYDPNEIVEVVVPKANQIKLADPITKTNTGEIIPIVKRDNFHNPDIRYKQGGVLKGQSGLIPGLIPKYLFELVAKRSNGAQTKSIPTILKDVVTGRDKSFYNENNVNGSNEIDTYLYGKPYNSEFTGDESIGPDYTNYIRKNYPNRDIKTYNTHFGDTLYIDNKAKALVEKQLNNGETVGGSMGRYAHAPSYIVTKEEGRPYDAGGHLMKFSRDENGNIVANMSDIYDFLPEDFDEKYNRTENPSWTRKIANNIGTPFIVRQNGIPVRFKEIVPEYKTDKQRVLGDFLSQWGNTYDLKLPLRLTDAQIDEIFDGRDYGDDILDFMQSKGYLDPQQ